MQFRVAGGNIAQCQHPIQAGPHASEGARRPLLQLRQLALSEGLAKEVLHILFGRVHHMYHRSAVRQRPLPPPSHAAPSEPSQLVQCSPQRACWLQGLRALPYGLSHRLRRPGLCATWASQHILLWGITDGATLCNSSVNTISFALQGLLSPQMAPMMADSRLLASFWDMSASSTPNSAAAIITVIIINAATVALRSKPPEIVRVFFNAFLASPMRR